MIPWRTPHSPRSGTDFMREMHITAWNAPVVTPTSFDQQAHS